MCNVFPICRLNKSSLIMAIKLCFITGVPMLFEIIAWVPTYFPDQQPFLRDNLVYFLQVTNVLTASRGVIIFVIFIVLQANVRTYLWLHFSSLFRFKISIRSKGDVGVTSGIFDSTSGTNQLSDLTVSVSVSEGDEKSQI